MRLTPTVSLSNLKYKKNYLVRACRSGCKNCEGCDTSRIDTRRWHGVTTHDPSIEIVDILILPRTIVAWSYPRPHPSETDDDGFIDDNDVTIPQAHTNCTGGGQQRRLRAAPTMFCASIADLSTFLTMTASKSNEYKRLFSPRSRNPRCLPELKDPSISKFGLVVNGDTPASQRWILLMIQFFSNGSNGTCWEWLWSGIRLETRWWGIESLSQNSLA